MKKLYRLTANRCDYYRREWGKSGSYEKIFSEETIHAAKKNLENYRGPATGYARYERITVKELTQEEIQEAIKTENEYIHDKQKQVEYLQAEIKDKEDYVHLLQSGIQ